MSAYIDRHTLNIKVQNYLKFFRRAWFGGKTPALSLCVVEGEPGKHGHA